MDRIIIAKVSSAQEMAYFMISLTIFVTPLTIAGQSISNYVVIHIKNVKSGLNKYIDNILFLSLLILGLAAIVLYVFSHWIIVSLFGEKYIPSIAYGLLCASISILSNMRVIYIGCLRGLGLNWPVSIFQSVMLMSLVVIYVLYLNLSLDISQVLWGFIILQTIFFTTFYMFNRFKYLRYHKQIQ
jgi:O-antigen/teichoic acid export membrane protein